MPQHYIAPFDFPDHEYNERLIPRSHRSVFSPNPSPATSAITRAIATASPLPGEKTLETKELRTRIVVAVILCAMAVPILIFEDLSFSSGWQGLAAAFFAVLFVATAARNLWSIRSSTWVRAGYVPPQKMDG